ncbi:MAG: TIGR03960 family B12-binding radical SAM protein [Candidatus Hydrogenedentota bacterium]
MDIKKSDGYNLFCYNELIQIKRPAQYLNCEYGSIVKDFNKEAVRFVIGFPEVYEIGMSNLGIQIIYDMLNNIDSVLCDRIFLPAKDYYDYLLKNNIILTSLHYKKKLSEFDIIGISIPYELTYANILKLLRVCGVSILAERRNDKYPLVIGGGSGVFTPEPLGDFFDLFYIGEAENGLLEIINVFKECKGVSKNKIKEILKKEVHGLYDPLTKRYSFVDYNIYKEEDNNKVRNGAVVKKRISSEFGSIKSQIVPNIDIIHNRISVEVSRGCIQNCRFCQATYLYKPYRERDIQSIVEELEQRLYKSGYNEAAFSGLSVMDYSRIDDLISYAVNIPHLNISLPSMRINSFDTEVLKKYSGIRRTGITLAPEVASERLQKIINKNVNLNELFNIVGSMVEAGWRRVKLYFMIGLPYETEEDIKEIARLCNILASNRKLRYIGVTISQFVPKPHTPFQWLQLEDMDILLWKMKILRDGVKSRKIELRFHNINTILLESVLSKMGREAGSVIMKADEKGAGWEGWNEYFDIKIWEDAFLEDGLEIRRLASQKFGYNDVLPWDGIDTYCSKEYLWKEYESARNIKSGIICQDDCRLCGVCSSNIRIKKSTSSSLEGPQITPTTKEAEEKINILVRFKREAEISYVSHIEFEDIILKSFKRAGIELKYSKGYSPRPLIYFARTLPLGYEIKNDYFTIILDKPARNDLKDLVNDKLPAGIKINDISYDENKTKIMHRCKKEIFYVKLICNNLNEIDNFLKEWGSRMEFYYDYRKRKSGKVERIDLKKYIQLKTENPTDNKIDFIIENKNMNYYFRPDGLLDAFGLKQYIFIEKIEREIII